jgi:hypothetical protein
MFPFRALESCFGSPLIKLRKGLSKPTIYLIIVALSDDHNKQSIIFHSIDNTILAAISAPVFHHAFKADGIGWSRITAQILNLGGYLTLMLRRSA